jgi:hypothetical protein
MMTRVALDRATSTHAGRIMYVGGRDDDSARLAAARLRALCRLSLALGTVFSVR